MADMKKIKRAALVLFGIVTVLLLRFLVDTGIITGRMIGQDMTWNAFVVGALFVPVLIMSASLLISLTLLYAIRKEETPFNLKNVRRLKAMAIILVLFEPCMLIAERIHGHFNPFYIGTNEWGEEFTLFVYTSWSGFILAAGLITFCVALVFQYGISLQTQVDETL